MLRRCQAVNREGIGAPAVIAFHKTPQWRPKLCGGFAVLTAMTPCNCWCDALGGPSMWHRVFAIALFGSMASVVWLCAEDTITLLPTKALQARVSRHCGWVGGVADRGPQCQLSAPELCQPHVLCRMVRRVGLWVLLVHEERRVRITSAEKRALTGELQNVKGYGLAPVGGLFVGRTAK